MTNNVRPLSVNRLLASLPRSEHKRLALDLKPVELMFSEILYESGDRIEYVYFPSNSIISLLSTMSERSTLEVGMVGNEGIAGLSVFMGVDTSANRAIVQGTGSALRLSSSAIRREANRLGSLHRLLHRYTNSLLLQISQSSICNRFHSVDSRLAKWLLMTRDRLGADEFRLTQEFMSNMLGVRREGVNRAAGALQTAKLICYSRGKISILNGRRLQEKACCCYGIVKSESEQYLSSASTR